MIDEVFKQDRGGCSVLTRIEAEVAFNKDAPEHKQVTDSSLCHGDLRKILVLLNRVKSEQPESVLRQKLINCLANIRLDATMLLTDLSIREDNIVIERIIGEATEGLQANAQANAAEPVVAPRPPLNIRVALQHALEEWHSWMEGFESAPGDLSKPTKDDWDLFAECSKALADDQLAFEAAQQPALSPQELGQMLRRCSAEIPDTEATAARFWEEMADKLSGLAVVRKKGE